MNDTDLAALLQRPLGLSSADEAGVRPEIVGGLPLPDISIFCREPDELDEAITLVPEAVIVNPGYAAKDLEIGPRFYLLQGVKDVIVFDPHTLLVLPMRKKDVTRQVSPVDIVLECGCRCVV